MEDWGIEPQTLGLQRKWMLSDRVLELRRSGDYPRPFEGYHWLTRSDVKKSIDGAMGGTSVAALWLFFVR